MIKSAREARIEISKGITPSDPNQTYKRGEAIGYLSALEGPEVKALVEALEDCVKNFTSIGERAEKALSQYRQAVKGK